MIAIDLGSNTIRFIEYDGSRWGNSFEKIVRTAESLHQTRQITDAAINRIINAITEAKETINFNTDRIIAVTTAAMRIAVNAHDVLETLYRATGIRFTIIDAKTEADCTLRAVRYRLQKLTIEPSSFILADIGGGSTELIRVENEKIDAVSLNIGIVTLSESINPSDTVESQLESFKSQICRQIAQMPGSTLILTAGTPTTIAAYLLGMDYESYDPVKINGYRLTLRDCYRAYNELMAMDESSRIRYVGVGRENLIAAGILMVTAIYEALAYEDAIIVDDGLREGVALAYYDKECHIF